MATGRAPRLLRYGVALLGVLVALGVSLLLPDLFLRNPFLLFFGAVTVATWYGGRGPGLVAVLFSVPLVDYLLVEPIGAFSTAPHDVIRIVVFIAITLLISSLYSRRLRAEAELARSSSRLDAILAAVADGVTVQERDNRVSFANDAAARQIGFPTADAFVAAPADTILQNFELMDESGAPLPAAELPGRRVLHGAASAERVIRFRVRDTGQERWSLVRATPIRDGTGAVTAAVNTFHDITDLKTAETSLADQREWFRVTLAGIGDAVIATDAQARVAFMNPIAESLTGWSADDAIGQPILNVFHIVNETTRDRVPNPVAAVLADGVIVDLANHTLLIGKDGTERPIDDSAAPIRDAGNRVIGAVLVFRDVTERRKQAEALQAINQRLQTLIEASPLAIYVSDLNGTVSLWSPAAERMFGYGAGELIGRPLPTIPEADREAWFRLREQIRDQRRSVLNVEGKRVCKNGTVIDVSFSTAPLTIGDGTITEFVTIVTDITERKQAEEAIRASNAQIREIWERIAEAFYALDHDWRLTYVNQQAADQWGKSREDLLGRVLWDVFPQVVGTHAHEAHLRAAREQTVVSYEAVSPVLRAWVGVNIYPSPSGVSVYFRNIDERKRHEIAQRFLAEAGGVLNSSLNYEKTLATVASLATPAIADWCAIDILTADEDLQRVAVAHIDPAQVQWAYDLQQKYPVDLDAPSGVPNVLRTGSPEFYPRVDEDAIIASIDDPEMAAIIKRIGFRSAMVVPLTARERTFGAITLVATAESGRNFDADDLALAEELGRRAALAVDNARLFREAQAQRERLQVTLASIGDGVIVTNADGEVTFMNAIAEELTGWALNDAGGQPLERVFRIVNEETRATVENPVTKVLRLGSIVGLANHTVLIRRDGSELPIDDSGAPIRDDTGIIAGVVLVFRDVSERRVMEQARAALLRQEQAARRSAEDANNLKLKFLAMISHELRTPLTSIKGFTSTLLAPDVAWDPSVQREFVAIMDQEADKLADLVEQLLDVTRLQAGTLSINPQVQPVENVVNAAMAQLQAITADHQFTVDVPDSLPPVSVDAQRVGQVIVNLVQNAARYSPARSRISLVVSNGDQAVRFEVSDEGEGIPPDERDMIFEAFRQVDRRTGGRQKGAGLGLAICKGLVEAHGGRIWVDERPGPGTTMCFTLPIEQSGNSE